MNALLKQVDFEWVDGETAADLNCDAEILVAADTQIGVCSKGHVGSKVQTAD